jgi:hypothetical protein
MHNVRSQTDLTGQSATYRPSANGRSPEKTAICGRFSAGIGPLNAAARRLLLSRMSLKHE